MKLGLNDSQQDIRYSWGKKGEKSNKRKSLEGGEKGKVKIISEGNKQKEERNFGGGMDEGLKIKNAKEDIKAPPKGGRGQRGNKGSEMKKERDSKQLYQKKIDEIWTKGGAGGKSVVSKNTIFSRITPPERGEGIKGYKGEFLDVSNPSKDSPKRKRGATDRQGDRRGSKVMRKIEILKGVPEVWFEKTAGYCDMTSQMMSEGGGPMG